jgi:hypothetical protein
MDRRPRFHVRTGQGIVALGGGLSVGRGAITKEAERISLPGPDPR